MVAGETPNTTYPLPATLVSAFQNGTWIENIAVRQNGLILATQDSAPRLYQVNPFESQDPVLLHEFPDTASILGIVETSPDVFHVCTANYSGALLKGYGEAYIYRINMSHYQSGPLEADAVTFVTSVAEAQALDGLTYLGGRSNLLLAADFLLGVIFSIDINTGDSRVVINNTYTRSTGFGVNGLRMASSTELYFTNSQLQTLVKVTLDATTGEPVSEFTVLTSGDGNFEPDDFAVNSFGDAYVTSFLPYRNGLVFVPREGGNATFIAGVTGPTSAAFGRTLQDATILYISTSGGDYDYYPPGPVGVAGKIYKIEVGRHGTLPFGPTL
ncbi:hypothetical protein K461DRAFT_283817 [Myriangium duriaei CBS 260.36]|uniref:SMP-30/Gluconolactonase/LRE-like region domain-containing protein n=1 Tax=Myriangium duriaei CBS 260.36 TaxID=1168546 RepID=A0A9P4MPA9_9PEZI|nr:hypothetical protein K461DRAFT_283817 [Myriangium duriaei CBS 260.36]